MLASSLSHNGLTGLGVKMFFTVHKLEHELSGFYDEVPHGAGLSILFPAWARFLAQKNPHKLAKFAISIPFAFIEPKPIQKPAVVKVK